MEPLRARLARSRMPAGQHPLAGGVRTSMFPRRLKLRRLGRTPLKLARQAADLGWPMCQ
jgi:hypothetical protein